MKSICAIAVAIWLVVGVSWVVNFIKLTDCDFEPNYKCEVIHSIGIIPFFAPITVWFGVDGEE